MSTHLGSAHLDPADDDTPVSNSHEAKATAFAEAIGKVLKMKQYSKPNSRNQNLFDGSDSRKLHTFMLQCKLQPSEIAKIYLRTILIRSIMSSHS